jgi:hypothetical protein
MEGKIRHLAMLLAALAVLACDKQGPDGERPVSLVPVQLAVRVSPGDDAATKGDPSVITEMEENFRGISGITMLAFGSRTQVSPDDRSLYHPFPLPGITGSFSSTAYDGVNYFSGLVRNNNAHLYGQDEVNLPGGTASVLVYGSTPETSAATDILRQHLNGALTVSGLEAMPTLRQASDISFSPVVIYDGGIPEEGAEIAGILNDIAGAASYTTDYAYKEYGVWKEGTVSVPWNESIADSRLKEYFEWFTNEGRLSTGAGVNVEYMLSNLYRILSDYTSYEDVPYEVISSGNVYQAVKSIGSTEPLTYADLYNGVRDLILSRYEALQGAGVLEIEDRTVRFSDAGLRSYPAGLGLPDGAAALSWSGTAFAPVSETLDGVAPLSSYCYPPRLWYFANTTISTAGDDRTPVYTSEHPSWSSDILSTYRSGKVIHGDTKSVALDEPLQYSCGLLEASVRATTSQLDDADGNMSTVVTLTDDNLPVTGVIIGSQRALNYDFTPQSGASDHFLYDNCIEGVYLTRTGADSAPVFHTLVSQTPDNTPVYFCLELRNDTGSSFIGADGIVLPGAKFYLLGTIELPSDHSFERVFEQDYATRINCIVSSLAEARTAVPDLGHPHLSMGLQVDINWIQATPSYLILY